VRAARGTIDGEAVDVVARPYLTDPARRRLRDFIMARLRSEGQSAQFIADTLNVSKWLVYKRLKSMPESARRKARAS
jgi:transposase